MNRTSSLKIIDFQGVLVMVFLYLFLYRRRDRHLGTVAEHRHQPPVLMRPDRIHRNVPELVVELGHKGVVLFQCLREPGDIRPLGGTLHPEGFVLGKPLAERLIPSKHQMGFGKASQEKNLWVISILSCR